MPYLSVVSCLLSSAEHYVTLQMDAVDSSGLVVPVSLWSYKLNDASTAAATHSCETSAAADQRRRRLLALEPVNTITAHVIFDSHVSSAVINCSVEMYSVL